MAAAPPIALKRLDVLDELEAAFDRGVKKARGAGRYSAPQRAALGAVLGAVKAAVFLEIRRHCEADQPGESAERPVWVMQAAMCGRTDSLVYRCGCRGLPAELAIAPVDRALAERVTKLEAAVSAKGREVEALRREVRGGAAPCTSF
jgi:hypothetical protein